LLAELEKDGDPILITQAEYLVDVEAYDALLKRIGFAGGHCAW
jgi:hypothetical protein